MDERRVFTEWSRQGIIALKPHVAVFVIIDVLSFCTAVDIAVSRGASIIPFPHGDESLAAEAATRLGAICASRRTQDGGYSLSPQSLLTIEPGTTLLLPSPNGATLALECGDTPTIAGCLRNATAVAQAARSLAGDGAIGIIPAGERWPDNSLRPAIEDWLGAGAVIDALDLPLSAESRASRETFRAFRHGLQAIVTQSKSGRELLDRGYPADIALATALDASRTVAGLRKHSGSQQVFAAIEVISNR